MLLVLLSKFLGRVLAWLPESLLALVAKGAGTAIYHLPIRRSREMRSNLHHAFPERDAAWQRRVGKLTSARLVEMAFFALATAFLSRRWFENHLIIEPRDRENFLEAARGGGLFLLPHTTLYEMLSAMPAVLRLGDGHGVIYRPLKQSGLDRWVKATRERWGMRLISRKEGFASMLNMLRNGMTLTLLFDQNTGKRGNLFFFSIAWHRERNCPV